MKALSVKAPVSNPIVHIHRKQVTTSSLAVAEYFGKPHNRVLKAIRDLDCSEDFNVSNFRRVDYLDDKGEKRPAYEMTKDGFAFLAFGFKGQKAAQFKENYINAFNRMLDDLPADREAAIQAKRITHIGMTDAIKLTREHDGKEAKPYHFMNENLLCNEAAFGIRKGIDESTLTAPAAKLLERVRNYNETLILDGVDYQMRKDRLKAYADRQRSLLARNGMKLIKGGRQ